jgi:twitching motility protein PilT
MPENTRAADSLRSWLLDAAREGASDLHVIAGYSPILRRHGQLEPLDVPPISPADARAALLPLLPAEQADRFPAEKNADFALELDRDGHRQRYRANLFITAETLGACFRVIPDAIPDFEWAGFPRDLAERLAHFRNGLVILCGVTGAGKTTTLAMIINLLCHEGTHRIITVEEPIEYLFPKTTGSVVTQREVGRDVRSFAEGLKYALRQDPDVILVGEIRDRETAQTALSAAETGHLVFATLHTRDAKGAISRYADLFPQDVQLEIRSQLAVSLRAVVSQHLLPSSQSGEKRVLALESMFVNYPIASAIRVGKLESIDNYVQTGRADGMLTLNESVKRHFQAGRITQDMAERFVTDKAYLWR